MLSSFLFLNFQVVCSQGTWQKMDVPTDHFLRAVFFTDSLYGWAAGNGGIIIHTSDGGQNWTVQDSQTENDIADMVFLDRENGWAASHNYTVSPFGTIILKTNNGGEDWYGVPYPEENIFINCILLQDNLNGWMGGSPHALVKTADGGETWQQAAIDTSILAFFPVLCIQFWDDQYGYASGGMFEIAGVIWRTSDGGNTWYAIDPAQAPADEVHELYLYDSLNVIGAGGDPDFGYGVAVIRTHDGGLNWEYEELGLQGNSYDLDFRTEDEAWSPLGPRKKFIYSLNAGATWTPMDTPASTAIFDIMFPDSLHGFAVGDSGAFLKYKPPLGVSSDPVEPDEGYSFEFRNYPNPFRSATTISFTIPDFSHTANCPAPLPSYNHILLKVYNSMGTETATLLDQQMPPGEHQVRFDASGLAPGVYSCRLVINNTCTKSEMANAIKMVVIR